MGTHISGSVPVHPPPGFIAFCIRERTQCVADGSGQINLDLPTWRLLERVNAEVDANTIALDDYDNHGINEYWNIVHKGYGDCNDMAVTKRAELHSAGVPLHDLRLAVVLTPENRRHIVLTVVTDHGDLVLDSLNPDIIP